MGCSFELQGIFELWLGYFAVFVVQTFALGSIFIIKDSYPCSTREVCHRTHLTIRRVGLGERRLFLMYIIRFIDCFHALSYFSPKT